MKYITLILLLFALNSFGQDTTHYKNVDLVVIDPSGGGTDPVPCNCPMPTMEVKQTITLPAGQPATVVREKTPTGYIDTFSIPQGVKGDKGDPGTPGSGSGGTQTRNVFDVTLPPYGAIAGDNIDDLPAFQRAANDARAVAGLVRIPSPGNGASYILAGTWNIIPDASNQTWIDVEMLGGRAGGIKYTGPSNAAVVKIIGLKGGIFTGLNIAIENGRTGVQIFDIVTPNSAQGSTSFVTFNNFYLNLGNGIDNIGIRTGAFGYHGDISNYEFNNMIVYGGGGLRGASIAGQYAFQNLGMNTLSMSWKGGFVAFCDRAYSNVSRDGTQRGNGSVSFYALGGAHNAEDFVYGFEQAYKNSGGRWENGKIFMRVADGGYSSINIETLVIHDYVAPNGYVIDVQRASDVALKNVQITNTNTSVIPSQPIRLSANGRFGSLSIEGGGVLTNSAFPYTKTGNTQWNININGVAKMGEAGNVWSVGFFTNEIGVRK